MWSSLSGMLGGGEGEGEGAPAGAAEQGGSMSSGVDAAAEARRVREARLKKFQSAAKPSADAVPPAPQATSRTPTLPVVPKTVAKASVKDAAPKTKAKILSGAKPRNALARPSPSRARKIVLDTPTKCIGAILQVTLDQTKDSASLSNSSNSYTSSSSLSPSTPAAYLPALAAKWNADATRSKPLAMEFDDIQEIIQARLELHGQPPMGWVLASLSRAHKELSRGKDSGHPARITSVLAQIDAVLSNWFMTMLQVDNMFPPAAGHKNGIDEFAARLVGTLGGGNDRAAAMVAVEKLCAAGSRTSSAGTGTDAKTDQAAEFIVLQKVLREIVLGKSSPLRPNKKRKRNGASTASTNNNNPLANMMMGSGGAAAANNPLGAMLAQLSTGGAGGADGMFGSNSPNDVVVRMVNNGPYLAVQSTVRDLCRYKGALEHVLMACASWSNDHGNGISTGALLEHRTILGSLLCFGCTGHPDIPDDLFDPPSNNSESSGAASSSSSSAAASSSDDVAMAEADGDDIYGDGPSSAAAATLAPLPRQRLTSQERTWLTNRQQMYAMGISNPSSGHVPSAADHPLTSMQARQVLFSQPELMIGANDVALATRDFPRPFYTTIQQLQAVENRSHSASAGVWEGTARLVTSILKKKALRPRMVRWLARAVALQRGRGKSHRSIFRESSDSFSLNLFATHLRLFQPLMKSNPASGEWTMLGKIRGDFFLAPSVATVALQGVSEIFPENPVELPRLHRASCSPSPPSSAGAVAGTPTSEDISFATAEASKSFPTQCFFLTSMCMHLSIVPTIRQLDFLATRLLSSIVRQQGRESPLARATMSVNFVRQTEISSPDLLSRTVQFCSFQASWLLRAIGMNETITSTTSASSSSSSSWRPRSTTPSALARIPLCMLEDIATVMTFFGRACGKGPHFSNALATGQVVPNLTISCQPIIRVLTAFLAGGNTYVANPGVRTAIGDVFFYCFFDHALFHSDDGEGSPTRTMSSRPSNKPLLPPNLLNDSEIVPLLLPALLEVYGDAEHTGFYEAPGHRKRLTIVIRFLLAQKQHRDALLARSQGGEDTALSSSGSGSSSSSEAAGEEVEGSAVRAFSFISSVNGLMNQANSSITDGMSKLQAIKAHQDALRDHTAWLSQSEEERKQQESEFEANGDACKHHMKTAMQSLELFAGITEHVRKPFMNSILLGRVAVTLTTLLHKMVESQSSIKVDNPEKYHFHPKRMLRLVLLATMNMYDDGGKNGNSSGSKVVGEDSRRFVAAVAEFFTGSFDAAVLDKASRVIKKHGILLVGDLGGDGAAQWGRFAANVKEEVEVQVADEEMLGEVPDEFACQLLFTLMTDPVKLPDGTIVDRDSIMQQLLNTSKNPFTNLPMTVDDLVPLPELKVKINQWKADQRAKKV